MDETDGSENDTFTRRYMMVLGAVLVAVLLWNLYEDPEVGRLNRELANDTELSAYPYRFQVLRLKNGVATLGSPRSAQFSAPQALALLYPSLQTAATDSDAMINAQKEMARLQSKAGEIVKASDKVNRIAWELDEGWLRSKGVEPGLLR